IRPLAKAGLLALLDETQELYRRFRSKLSLIADKVGTLAKAATAAAGWRSPIGRADLTAVLALARRWNRKFLRFLFPSFWRLRRIVRQRFDFRSALVPPSYVDALGQLLARYEAEEALATAKLEIGKEFGIDDLDTTQRVVEDIHSRHTWTPIERE